MLARSWVSASEDHVASADQKAKVLFETLHHRIVAQGSPTACVLDEKCRFRTVLSSRKHVSEPSADEQKLSISLRKVRVCKLSGVNENEILSMGVAVVHMGKGTTMD